MRIVLDAKSPADYEKFIAIKSMPRVSFQGSTMIFPDEYASRIGLRGRSSKLEAYEPSPFLFEFQKKIIEIAVRKKKFAVFADCGLGKTLMFLDWAKHVLSRLPKKKCILIVSPLMVVKQTIAECARFYGDSLPVERVRSGDINKWLGGLRESRLGITNYEAMNTAQPNDSLGALILDESSMLKSHYGSWAAQCIEMGRGLDWKLALTGTPAPNDRIEYANHAVFLDRWQNINAFLATFFINRGQTDNRWQLKPHAIHPFYRALADFSIFVANPSAYGWKGIDHTIPPINVHIHRVDTTAEQTQKLQSLTGNLLPTKSGGVTTRGAMSQIAKGSYRGEKLATNKPVFIKSLVESWPTEQTIVWCWYNAEQEGIASVLPEAASITGDTDEDVRSDIIARFQAGDIRTLITKPRILGFGLNLQCCTRQVFSGLVDSYEAYYQAVKRSNRYGSTRPLNVHIPVTDLETPMVDSVLAKCKMVQEDTEKQEAIFRDAFTIA